MEKLILEGSEKTPAVRFDGDNGVMELIGRSIPENSIDFYEPLNNWLEKYGHGPKPNTTVNIKLEYFNTASSKCILNLLKQLEKLNSKDTKVKINWYFEEDEEDLEEAGEDYQAIIDLPFKMIKVK